MKYVAFALLLMIAPTFAHAQMPSLEDTARRCTLVGLDLADRNPAGAHQFPFLGGMLPMRWNDPEMARYCPNIITRMHVIDLKTTTNAQEQWYAALHHYGQ